MSYITILTREEKPSISRLYRPIFVKQSSIVNFILKLATNKSNVNNFTNDRSIFYVYSRCIISNLF